MAMQTYSFSVTSQLAASREQVWAHAISMTGINRELFPLVRMTYPASISELTPENVVLGKQLFRSWILLFGVLPIDYDDITLVELFPGGGFQENSTMLTQSLWRHRRTLENTATGCRITDTIEFVPRMRWLGPAFHPVFHFAFRLRHWNLRRIFGAASQVS